MNELTEIIGYQTMRVKVIIYYDKKISTVEAKQTAIGLIKDE